MNISATTLRRINGSLGSAKLIGFSTASLISGNVAYFKGDTKPMRTKDKIFAGATIALTGASLALEAKRAIEEENDPQSSSSDEEVLAMVVGAVTGAVALAEFTVVAASRNAISFNKAKRLPRSAMSRYAAAAQGTLTLALLATTIHELRQRRNDVVQAWQNLKQNEGFSKLRQAGELRRETALLRQRRKSSLRTRRRILRARERMLRKRESMLR